MILISALAVMQADLIDGLHIVPLVGSFAILAGLLLAKSRFPANTAHFYALIYGLFVVFYLVGTNLPDDIPWRVRVFDVVNRQLVWLNKAVNGGTSRDGLIFVIQTSAIFWLLGYTAAWYTFRKPRVWRVVVPTGLVLLSVVYYYAGPRPLSLYLAIYVLLALVYVARTHLVAQEKVWRAASVRYERGLRFSFLRAGFLASLLALIIAWSLPTLTANAAVNDALSGTRGPWREFQDNWTRLFSALRSYGTATSDPYQDTLILGGPRSVGNSPIMDVHVPRQLPYIYWQAIALDTYDNGGWFLTEYDSNLHFPDDGVLNTPFTMSREVITQTVVNYLPNSSFLYGAPEVIGSNRQMFVDAITDDQGSTVISAIRSRFVLRQGDTYQVISRVSTVDAQSLRAASTDYPAWVTDTYLQLPETITPETRELAEELAAPYSNAYDKAVVIQNYLRENITYNDQIAAAPDGVDPVHHTLFVSQEGYCTYYASAMAVMLRSQGIPARIVNGYAQGDYDDASGSYRVRASNAHTWVEAYFPEYGWIQFEPTASIPVVTRPETATGEGGDGFVTPLLPPEIDREALLGEGLDGVERGGDVVGENGLGAGSGISAFFANFPVWQALGGIVVLALALVVMVAASKLNKRVESDVDKSYNRLGSWARWLGVLFRPAHTPYERADLMAAAVPEGRTSIRNLTQQFVLRQFSQARAYTDGFDPLQEWQVLRPLLLRTVLSKRLQRWQKREAGNPVSHRRYPH
jgi:transglutaminase-like putative cysteine protease